MSPADARAHGGVNKGYEDTREQSEVDVVLMDLVEKGWSATEVARYLNKNFPLSAIACRDRTTRKLVPITKSGVIGRKLRILAALTQSERLARPVRR